MSDIVQLIAAICIFGWIPIIALCKGISWIIEAFAREEYESESEGEQVMITINVRWFDGYLETFAASEVRFGNALLWMRLLDGGNRHIPLSQVRWFSTTPESHEQKASDSQ